MPFGKYRGVELEDIPVSYLAWVRDNVDIRSETLRDAILDRLDDAEHDQGEADPAPEPQRHYWSRGSRSSRRTGDSRANTTRTAAADRTMRWSRLNSLKDSFLEALDDLA